MYINLKLSILWKKKTPASTSPFSYSADSFLLILFWYLHLVCLYLEYQNVPDDLIIGIFVGVLAILVIATFFVIALVNRRFYSRQIKLNSHYVGSVVSEHITTTLWRPSEQRSDICDVNISTDNSIYMLASSHRFENI